MVSTKTAIKRPRICKRCNDKRTLFQAVRTKLSLRRYQQPQKQVGHAAQESYNFCDKAQYKMVNQQDTRSQIGSVYEKSRGFPFCNFYRSLQTFNSFWHS